MMTENRMQFERVGGSCQLQITSASDLHHVLELDNAHWALTSIQTESMLCDPDFLRFMDTDQNGRIRIDEVRNALKWMLPLLRDTAGIDNASDSLELAALKEDHPEAKELSETIRIALANLGSPDATAITLAQISDQQKIIADALQNGDGVIPPDPIPNECGADCVRNVMALIGKKTDRSGAEGISEEELDTFETLAKGYLAWRDDLAANKAKILPFGENTEETYGLYKEIADKMDEFYRACEACAFEKASGARCTCVNTVDVMDPATVDAFLQKAPVSAINPAGVLDLQEIRNPLWRSKIQSFFAVFGKVSGKKYQQVSAADWTEVKSVLAGFKDWTNRKNTAIFDGFDETKLRKYMQEDIYSYLHILLRKDAVVEKNLMLCSKVRQLILYQQHMIEFLNNFVNMDHLFDDKKKSMIQAGVLILDGRHFTLCTKIFNFAEHKKIAEGSRICVMYVDAEKGTGASQKNMKLAVAVTSGNIRNIFIGKNGIFISRDGSVWDAKVTDLIQQPVSIPEAIQMPFFKFGEFLQKQADRFFASRSKQFEDQMAKDIETKTAAIPNLTKPAATPAPQQTPAVSGSMVLMGGGVGIAAIGSGFAFMAKSLQGVSVSAVLAMIFGILFVFGAPFVILSLVKLFRRNLSVFLEANGIALNGQMRLSVRMGKFFTYSPKLPSQIIIFSRKLFPLATDAVNSVQIKVKTWRNCLILVSVLVIELAVLFWLYRTELARIWRNLF